MSTKSAPSPVTDPQGVVRLATEIRSAGRFTLDLEFVSESRYVPELGLVQVAWGEAERPRVAAVDPVATDAEPLVSLVADPQVEVVLHAGQGDLSLLADRYGLRGRGVVDSQIAAAFLGLGDQVGYTGLMETLLGVELDKASQFTDWLRRPLSEEQLRYALDDVRYLHTAWRELERRLRERGRLEWVREESERLAETAARRLEPEEVYTKIGGWKRLHPKQLGALRALAAWRERRALEGNTPPSWLLPNRTVLELARRPPRKVDALAKVRGVKGRTVDRYGEEILQALREGQERPVRSEGRHRGLSEKGRTWASMVSGLIQARCREADVAPRFVGARADAETLVHWWVYGERDREPELPLLAGWRRELVGAEVLAWLAGEIALAADGETESGVRVTEV